ncbi:MAG: tetratricopeptide repeat protein [Verrucomicrobiota bacterium]
MEVIVISRSIEHPDSMHLRCAQGWLELGDHLEANEELERISFPFRIHPDVLLLRYEVHAKAKKWDIAVEIARTLVEVAPYEVAGWINQAFALRRMSSGGPKAAWNALLPAAVKFPTNPIIAYHLACYSCQMNRLKEANAWLIMAGMLGDTNEFKLMALTEPDLEPLWLAIANL